MIRVCVLILAIPFALHCTSTEAEGFGNRWRSNSLQLRFRTDRSRNGWSNDGRARWGGGNYGYAGNGGYGYPGAFPSSGFGYLYDPYATGRFKAPDLHNDPFFREANRYDSHFPGRRSTQRPPLQLQFPVESTHYYAPSP